MTDRRAELEARFAEVTDADLSRPAWRALLWWLARRDHRGAPEAAAAAFVEALRANRDRVADTFMAVDAPAAPRDPFARAAERARKVRRALTELDGHGEPLTMAMGFEHGWLRARPLDGPFRVAFLVGSRAWLAEVDDRDLAGRLARTARGEDAGMRPIDPRGGEPTPAAAAIAVEPVGWDEARSFHRRAWTRGGGPWMGVADRAPFALVSTCHAAVDGWVHARVTDAVLERSERRVSRPAPAPNGTRIGFAAATIDPAPRFAHALHAFVSVLDGELGEDGARRSVPVHVPIAPGGSDEVRRWSRRPLYGLFALDKDSGGLEPLDAMAARLPGWIAREASGDGLLAEVLRATLDVPLPPRLARRLIARRPWMDRAHPAARVLTGAGYLSWMRFEPSDAPRRPVFPSAVPSFADHRGGAGLSITRGPYGIAAGMTTSGAALGNDAAAARLLDAWREELGRSAERRAG